MSKRIYWAVEALGIANEQSADIAASQFTPGVQSVGITTNFNLEQIFELGQLEIYQDLEEVPDIEITVEKVFDQYLSLYARCTRPLALATPVADTVTRNIANDQNNECDVYFSVNVDTDEQAGDNLPDAFIFCSGMFVSSVNFNFVTDGHFTENVTLVGNHKVWTPGAPAKKITGLPTTVALDSGQVKKRQNIRFLGGAPTTIASMGASDIAITSITVSTDFGREEMNILGQRLPYHRFVTFPVEVSCEVELYVNDISSLAGGNQLDAFPNQNNLTPEEIKLVIESDDVADILSTGIGVAVHTLDLGTKNTIQSITWGGGDTGGSNATITLSYRNFNKLDYTYGGPATVAGLY